MQHKHAIECVDHSLRDLMETNTPFGGKVVLFCGDFRQILPVVPHGSIPDQANACLKSSYLWKDNQRLRLSINMRLQSTGNNTLNARFGTWLLDLGSGKL